ncbi:DUF305 domain-containing protein [Nocardioides nanhaiensis]|uniref:DUF305 domain-containing protein n=1 Tax=Nocardioides nanhaiensis TaxID=1476871 RepID=A0ABP8W204_9ACTN
MLVLGLAATSCSDGGAARTPSATAGLEQTAPGGESPVPNATDIGFSQDMATHHDQALLMAQQALVRGGPAVRSLGLSILSAQAVESGALRGWLRLWDEPPVNAEPMAWMSHGDDEHHAGGGASMPGMASAEELFELSRLRGAEFDRLFLQLMVRHHLGGVEMGTACLESDASPLVRDSARAMVAEQVEDLGVMRALLSDAGAPELAYP